ncbi:MAG TPA: tetratricopeptide repeat protein, partial [Nannocystis sp.]
RVPGPRWTEIVEAYVQAGRGLAAAHAAGLVHRDFKPSNAMIDADGRVRVLDFGLVRAQAGLDVTTVDASSSLHQMSLQLTHSGDVVGTPAYMSPEQIRGASIGPASDQFSLCVALYEALYGHLPFAGDSLGSLFRSIQRHKLPEPPRGSRVPAWVRAALLRGLHPVPEDRYASMDALLRALGASSTRRRRLGVGIGVGAAGVAALAGFLTARAQGPELCTGAATELAAVWNDAGRDGLGRALSAAGPAFDAELRPAVLAAIDEYAAAWTSSHRSACMARARGEQSDQMLDRRMACLAQRRTALGAALGVLTEGDAAVALEALRVVHDLPPVSRCDEVVVLAAEVPPPVDPEVAVAVDEVRRALARAESLARAGKIPDALALADRGVEEALRSEYRPLAAEALLVRGRLAINLALDRSDDHRLTRAMLTAIGSGMDEVAAEAAALAVFARSRFTETAARALDDVPLAEELARRLAQPEAILGLLANNVGTVHLARGELAQARAAFARSLARREQALPADHPELANTLLNLALVEDDSAAREQHLRRALDIFASAFGPAHPQTMEVRIMTARYLRDPNAAWALVLPGCEALGRFLPEDFGRRAFCLAELAHHEAEAGHVATAASHRQQASALLAGRPAALPVGQTAIIEAEAARDRGEPDPGVAQLRAAIARYSHEAPSWWERRDRAELLLVLGENLGPTAEAVATLTAAVADFEASKAQASDVYGEQCLARAHLRLAELLARGFGAKEAISRHLTAAETWYQAAGPAYAWRLQALADLRVNAHQ